MIQHERCSDQARATQLLPNPTVVAIAAGSALHDDLADPLDMFKTRQQRRHQASSSPFLASVRASGRQHDRAVKRQICKGLGNSHPALRTFGMKVQREFPNLQSSHRIDHASVITR